MTLDDLDQILAKAPYIVIWFIVILVTASVATQTYMYMEKNYVDRERASAVITGGSQYALDGRGRFLEDDLRTR